MKVKSVILLALFFLPALPVLGQKAYFKKMLNPYYDTNYITSYETDFTTRLFTSIRYHEMGYEDNMVGRRLAYRPNSRTMLGIGVNHGFLGVNIGFSFPFINEDDDKYGSTKYYDFTMRFFSRKYNVTVYLQNYKGYYLRNTKDMIPDWEEDSGYYKRSDIRSYTIGFDLAYIYNSGKFSCRAAILQNEWQKKSAGSLLMGGTVFYNAAIGDSSIVPSHLYYGLFFDNLKFNKSTNFSIGPTIGYAYTYVIKQHFFILGMVNGSLELAYTQLLLVENEEKVKSGTVFGIRGDLLLSAGYNSDRWYFGLSYINMGLLTQAPVDERAVSFKTGMLRINFVRRFTAKKPIRILNPTIW